jgi:hypothetical protein
MKVSFAITMKGIEFGEKVLKFIELLLLRFYYVGLGLYHLGRLVYHVVVKTVKFVRWLHRRVARALYWCSDKISRVVRWL